MTMKKLVRNVLKPEWINAHDEGYIYIHEQIVASSVTNWKTALVLPKEAKEVSFLTQVIIKMIMKGTANRGEKVSLRLMKPRKR